MTGAIDMQAADVAAASSRTPDRRRNGSIRRLSPNVRRALLTFHIVVSVGLLGDVAAFLAVTVRAGVTDDPSLAAASYELLTMFSVVFGIPLSFASLISGIVLGLGGKWGVLRHPWVTAKLLLILSIIVVGAFVLGPATEQMRTDGSGAETRLLIGAVWDVLALVVATGLSVYKPGRRRNLVYAPNART